MNKKPLGIALKAALLAPVVPFAVAQEVGGQSAQGNPLEEVVVTGRKRTETLFDSPTPITAISQEVIDTLRMNDARDFITLVPNAFLQENNAGTARDISIRGVSTPTLFAESGVATYIDDVYASGFISYPTQFYDLERIEVLRGPQGALYGRNAVGGAMNVISARPDDEFGGNLRATFARYDRQEYEGMLNVPLGEKAAMRVVGWRTDQEEGAFFNPVAREYLDANESRGGRAVLTVRPTQALTATLIYEATDAESPGTALYFPTDGETPDAIPRDTHPRNAFQTERAVLNVDYSIAAGTFTLIAGTRSYELDGVEDTDLTGDNPFDLAQGLLGEQVLTRYNEVESDYAELRWLSPQLGPVSVLAGFSYLDESAVGDLLTDLPTVSSAFTGGTLPVTLGLQNDQSVESWAGFAEVTWDLSPTLSAIASARYTVDEKTVDFAFAPSEFASLLVGAAQTAQEDETFKQWTPGLTLAWEPADSLRLYGKVQTGFRAGGYNFNVGSAENLPYDEETSISYEIGAKSEVFDGRGVIGANLFLLEQDDVLVPLFDFTVPGPLGGYLANVSEAETLGLELEASLSLTPRLSLGGTLGWLDASFQGGTDSFGNNLDGNELPASRELTYTLTADYRLPLGNEVELFANAVYTYRDSGWNDVANSQPISEAEVLNAALGIEYRGFQLLGYVRNALDDRYEIAFGGFRPGGQVGVQTVEGEVYGMTLKYSF